jgi:hypothetical protein
MASSPVQRHTAAGGNPQCSLRPVQQEAGPEAVCENCAREDDELIAVHRVYVVPESWDTPASSTTVEEVELWCFSCRSMYPHEVIEAEP